MNDVFVLSSQVTPLLTFGLNAVVFIDCQNLEEVVIIKTSVSIP